MDLSKIFDNPITRSLLKSTLQNYLKDNKLHGVYVGFDNDGKLQLTDYTEHPQKQIDKLKKIIYE